MHQTLIFHPRHPRDGSNLDLRRLLILVLFLLPTPGCPARAEDGLADIGDRGHGIQARSAAPLVAAGLLIVFLTATTLIYRRAAGRRRTEHLKEIQSRERLEQCLLDSRQKYRDLVDNLPHRIFLKDRASRYVHCNRAYAKDLGIPVEQIAGHADDDFFPPDMAARYHAHDREVIRSGSAVELEDDYLANKTYRSVQIVKVPVFDDDGRVTGILGVLWDISRQKETEKALIEREKQFRTLIDQASDAVTIADMKGKIVDANIKACESLGYSYDEMLAAHMNTFDPLIWSPHTPPAIWKKLSEQAAVITESAYHRKNGTSFPVEVSMSLHRESGRNLVLSIARDITPRHLALKQRASMGRIIEESLSETYILASEDLRFMVVNRGARKNIGRTADELRLQTITAICPELTGEAFHSLVQPLEAKERDRINLETTFYRKDGTSYPVEISVQTAEYMLSPVFVIQAVDLTQRKKYEQELRNAVDIIDKSSSVAFIWRNDEGLPVIFVSRNVRQIFDYPADELLAGNKPYCRLIHPDDYDNYIAEIQSGTSNPRQEIIDHCAYRIVTGNGEIKWVSDYTYIKRDGDGSILFLQGIVEDITTLKESELALRRSRDEWERTFHAIPDIVTLLDRDYRIFKINQAGCIEFNSSSHDLIGRACHELFSGGSSPCAGCPAPEAMQNISSRTREIHHVQLDKTFLVTTSPVLDDHGEVNFIVQIAKDITAHKKLEQQLFLSEKMATIAGLAAGVAHEINTPLSAILQSIQVVRSLVDPAFPDNQRTARECGIDLHRVNEYMQRSELDFFLDGIRNSALNASRIITNLLDFSRPQKGDMQETDINQLLDNSLNLVRADYNLKKKYDIINIDIRREYDAGLPPVNCIPMEIEQVVLNLVKNAVQAMADFQPPEKSRITLRTGLEGEAVRIEVEDNGPGIEESVQKHIFDPFYTTKEIGIGTGLGLSVSYAIVQEKHHGSIRVESKKGHGARFVVLLPLQQKV